MFSPNTREVWRTIVERNTPGHIVLTGNSNCRTGIIRMTVAVVSLLLLLGITLTSSSAAGDMQTTQTHVSDSPEPMSQEHAKKIAVAKVNGVSITMESVVKMMKNMGSRIKHGSARQQDMGALRQEALNKLILQELAYQRAKAQGLLPAPAEVDAAVQKVKTRLGSEEGFTAFLEKEAMSEKEFRTLIETNMAIGRIIEKEVSGKIIITGDDVKKEYESRKDTFNTPEKILIADVLFFLDTRSEDSRKKVEDVLMTLRADKDNDPLKLSPDGTFIVREVELTEGSDRELFAAAQKLTPGELSGIVTTSDSLHVIKVLKHTPATRVSFEDVRSSLEKKLRADAQREKMKEWEAELRKGAVIEIIQAKEGGQQ